MDVHSEIDLASMGSSIGGVSRMSRLSLVEVPPSPTWDPLLSVSAFKALRSPPSFQ